MIRKLLLVGVAALGLAACGQSHQPSYVGPAYYPHAPWAANPATTPSDTTAKVCAQHPDFGYCVASGPPPAPAINPAPAPSDTTAKVCAQHPDFGYCVASGPPPAPAITSPVAIGHSEIALHRDGGVLTVPVSINGALTLDFILDSGAADVSIPADVVMTLMRTGTINRGDFLGSRTYVMADGSTAPSPIFRIRSLRVGAREVRNVTASIAPVKGGLLLGQSFLRQFGSWSIDNQRGVLVLD